MLFTGKCHFAKTLSRRKLATGATLRTQSDSTFLKPFVETLCLSGSVVVLTLASHAEDQGSNPVRSRQARSPSCDWYRIYPGNYARRISVTRFPLQCKLQCSCNSLPPFGMSVNLHIRRSQFPLGTHQVLKKPQCVDMHSIICTCSMYFLVEATHGTFRTCTSYN